MEKAQELDPLSPVVIQTLGNLYIFAERYDDAIAQADKCWRWILKCESALK
jgi:hypothetical protein